MKTCNKCGQSKPYSDFHKRKSGYQPWCKSCKKADDKKYYQQNKDKWNEYNKIWKKDFVEWYRSLKNSPCVDCGNSFDPVVMDWDHLPKYSKNESVSVVARAMNKQKVLEEIQKCELVCANCHRLRTKDRFAL